jgi:hypothetical protein
MFPDPTTLNFVLGGQYSNQMAFCLSAGLALFHQPLLVGLGKRLHRPLHAVGPLLGLLRVPLATRLGEEVSTIDVNRSGKHAPGVGYRMDSLLAQNNSVLCLKFLESSPDQSRASGVASEESIVLLSSVQSDDCPQVMVVGI